MSKKNKKKICKDKANYTDDNYTNVAAALALIAEMEIAERKRNEANLKAKKVLGLFILIGSVILIALSQITTYSFDFAWMSDAKKWYSDVFISFSAYVIVTDVVLLLEKYLKFDQKPIFKYIWPFIGFLISLILTNSIQAEFIPGEARLKFTIFIIVLIPSSILMYSSYQTGKSLMSKEMNVLKTAKRIIEDNPSTVDKVINDFETETGIKDNEHKEL